MNVLKLFWTQVELGGVLAPIEIHGPAEAQGAVLLGLALIRAWQRRRPPWNPREKHLLEFHYKKKDEIKVS